MARAGESICLPALLSSLSAALLLAKSIPSRSHTGRGWAWSVLVTVAVMVVVVIQVLWIKIIGTGVCFALPLLLLPASSVVDLLGCPNVGSSNDEGDAFCSGAAW